MAVLRDGHCIVRQPSVILHARTDLYTGTMPKQAASRRVLARLDGIDTLRGLSILAVILLHIWIRVLIDADFKLGQDWPPMLRSLVWRNGGNGVTIFFALSGFSITLTSLRRFGSLGRMQMAVFYRLRFARIMPMLLLLLLALSILHLLHVPEYRLDPQHFTLPRALFSALTFHLNWLEAVRNKYLPPCWTVLWSLSIEEAFYVFFPLVSVLLLRRWRNGRYTWFTLALAFVVMGPFARTVWSHTDLQQENSYLAGISDIAVGCMAAWLPQAALQARRAFARRILVWMQVLGWLPILWFATWPRWYWLRPASRFIGRSGLDDTLLALGTSLIAAATTLAMRPGLRLTAPLRWLGRHSYELYLSHEFLVLIGVPLMLGHLPTAHPRIVICAAVIAILTACALLAWALAKFFSEPLNRRLRGAPLPTQA